MRAVIVFAAILIASAIYESHDVEPSDSMVRVMVWGFFVALVVDVLSYTVQ